MSCVIMTNSVKSSSLGLMSITLSDAVSIRAAELCILLIRTSRSLSRLLSIISSVAEAMR